MEKFTVGCCNRPREAAVAAHSGDSQMKLRSEARYPDTAVGLAFASFTSLFLTRGMNAGGHAGTAGSGTRRNA
jgi:hypothetical protein